jgi:hypothetical protein
MRRALKRAEMEEEFSIGETSHFWMMCEIDLAAAREVLMDGTFWTAESTASLEELESASSLGSHS